VKPFRPHPYQHDAIQFGLSNCNNGLLLDPGWGKTAIVLAIILVLKQQRKGHRALVVAPPRVAANSWPGEFSKWTDFASGLTLRVMVGTINKRERMLSECSITPPDVIVVSYDSLDWVMKSDVIGATKREVLVLDESTFIKSPATKRFKLLRKELHRFGRRIILTGTPVPQGYEDLWSQIFCLDQGGALGRFITHYRGQYFFDAGYGFSDYQLRAGAADEINEKIKPLVFRGDAPEVRAAMPDVTFSTRRVELPAKVAAQYAELERTFFLELGDAKFLPPNAAALSMKLRQVCNGMARAEEGDPTVEFHDEKIEALRGMVEELNGNPLLVFYEFVADRDRICNAFAAPYIGGGVSDGEVTKLIKEFNEGKHRMLVVHPASGGIGLNLQEVCHNVAWFGPTWRSDFWIQGNARVARQGQTRPVMVTNIVAAGTVDDKVADALERKLTTQDALLDAMRG
jgi:SNF2 family DNA or RNA helicase